MLTNSLFLDFLKENGLQIKNEESTRDIICLEFNYGTRSYRQEIDHLHKTATAASFDYKKASVKKDSYLLEKVRNKRERINDLVERAYRNKSLYKFRTKEEIRTFYYNNGVNVVYVTKNKNGEVVKSETIHYKMLFRSTGKAKKGSCMFIRDELYDLAHNFLYMGIQLPEHDAKIVEISAYAPLVSSGIIGRVIINPKNILILDDVDRFFTRDVVSIETDVEKHCYAKWIDKYQLKNTLFDGQALIDTSVFPEWANGYVLLRHHFTKMAAFHTNIQLFFQDWCRENNKDYETATVKDYWGNDHYLKDIEVITTTNAVKWIKFNISYDYWCEWVQSNDCQFGVVKFSHPSKLGEVQKMSYQMVNSLDESTMPSVCQDTVDYIQKLKNDEEEFKSYLRKHMNFSNDYEVLLNLCDWNKDFVRCSYYRERKSDILSAYLLNIKNGEIIQNADNLTIVGSPYAMLLYAASGNEADCDKDDTFSKEQNVIQCYTLRFDDDEYLAGFRSPFNGKFNLTYLHNHYDDRLKRYFNFSKQIIAVNMIGTDFQDRNNGSDQDSDSQYVTNQQQIVEHSKRCYVEYPTIVNNIPKDTNSYNNTLDDFAAMDNALANSQLDIGESSNLAQLAQTYACNFEDPKFDNYVAILSILAQAAIDSAKRRFDINIADEIKLIKENMDIKKNKYPKFWRSIKRGFNSNNINSELHCPMNSLQEIKPGYSKTKKNTIPIGNFLEKPDFNENRRRCKRVEEMIEKYSISLYETAVVDLKINGGHDWDRYLLLRSDFDDLINDIRRLKISKNYKQLVYWLINRAFLIEADVRRNRGTISRTTDKNKSLLLKILYEVNTDVFLSCFKKTL